MSGLQARRGTFFSSARCTAVRTHDRTVHQPQVAVDASPTVQTVLQRVGHPAQCSISAPTIKPMVNRLPRPIALGQIAPRGTAAQHMEHPVEHQARILNPATSARRHRNMGKNQFPFLVAQIESTHPCLPVRARFHAGWTEARLRLHEPNEKNKLSDRA